MKPEELRLRKENAHWWKVRRQTFEVTIRDVLPSSMEHWGMLLELVQGDGISDWESHKITGLFCFLIDALGDSMYPEHFDEIADEIMEWILKAKKRVSKQNRGMPD
jgi:hypothetical protein